MKDCHFCQQIDGEIAIENKVYEDDRIVIMDDDHPHGPEEPMHLIVVAKEHMASNHDGLSPAHLELIPHIFAVASDLAIKMGIKEGLTVRFLICKDRPVENSHFHCHLMCSKPLDPAFILR